MYCTYDGFIRLDIVNVMFCILTKVELVYDKFDSNIQPDKEMH